MAEHLGEPGVQLTWGDLKAWALLHDVPDTAKVVDGPDYLNDLSTGDGELRLHFEA